MPRREPGCPHGGRTARECDACEVERLRARVSELEGTLREIRRLARGERLQAIRLVVRDALKAPGRR